MKDINTFVIPMWNKLQLECCDGFKAQGKIPSDVGRAVADTEKVKQDF
jgi:hypothetical protein